MITKEQYNALLQEYGWTSSWAVWSKPDISPKSNTSDLSVFKDPELLNILNNEYVFIGLNGSSTHGDQGNSPWTNFHSNYAFQNDYKLRYALMDTPFWGSYITDVIKHFPEVDSAKVNTHLRNNPQIIKENIDDLRHELSLLSDKNPVLIAMGGSAYEILNSCLAGEYTILQIKHYSYTIGKEDYRKEVLSVLGCKDNKKVSEAYSKPEIAVNDILSPAKKGKRVKPSDIKNSGDIIAEKAPDVPGSSGNRSYDVLFARLSELEKEYGIEIRHRSMAKMLNGTNRDILIKHGSETLCGIYVAVNNFKIWTNMKGWRSETIYDCTEPKDDGYYQYYVPSVEQCFEEIRKIAEYKGLKGE